MAIFEGLRLQQFNELVQAIEPKRSSGEELLETDLTYFQKLQEIIKRSASKKEEDSDSSSGTQSITLSKNQRKKLDTLCVAVLHAITQSGYEKLPSEKTFPQKNPDEYIEKEASWYYKAMFIFGGLSGFFGQALTGIGIAAAMLILAHAMTLAVVWPVGLFFAGLRVTQFLMFDLGQYAETLGVGYFDAGETLKKRIELFEAMKLFYDKCHFKDQLPENHQAHLTFVNTLFSVYHTSQEETREKMKVYQSKWWPYFVNRGISVLLLGSQLTSGFLAIFPASHLVLGLFGISAVAVGLSNPVCLALSAVIFLSIICGYLLMYYPRVTKTAHGLFGHSAADYQMLDKLDGEVSNEKFKLGMEKIEEKRIEIEKSSEIAPLPEKEKSLLPKKLPLNISFFSKIDEGLNKEKNVPLKKSEFCFIV